MLEQTAKMNRVLSSWSVTMISEPSVGKAELGSHVFMLNSSKFLKFAIVFISSFVREILFFIFPLLSNYLDFWGLWLTFILKVGFFDYFSEKTASSKTVLSPWDFTPTRLPCLWLWSWVKCACSTISLLLLHHTCTWKCIWAIFCTLLWNMMI